ncbi:hypothetical protein LTR22_001799 [Elasticomyces elasticus]|nr:hypothetical protein LTR22_001799 [Elasticomyces elasticus]KAK4932639.1 hypothetical protein LTR49_001063 [Elasticomyces elasticus]
MHFPNGSSAEYAYAVPLDHGLPGGTIDVGALGDMAALEQAGYRRLAYRYSGDGRPDFQLRYRYQSNWMSDDNSSADLSSSALVVPRSNSQTVNLTDQAIDDCSSTVALVTAKYSESGAIYSPFPSDTIDNHYRWHVDQRRFRNPDIGPHDLDQQYRRVSSYTYNFFRESEFELNSGPLLSGSDFFAHLRCERYCVSTQS